MTKFIKNVSFDVSRKNLHNIEDSSSEVEILDLFEEDDSDYLKGKYVDENGNSFPAEYYYDSYGEYNAKYKDGSKNINVKFNVDGTIQTLSFISDENL